MIKWIIFLCFYVSLLYADQDADQTRDVTKYAAFRPKYPTELIELLRIKFTPDGKGRLLDLGCGSGQITFLLAPYYKEVVAFDIDHKMIQEAKQRAAAQNVENIVWFIKPAEEISTDSQEEFDLITIATAFHWMDRNVVLNHSYKLLKAGGGIAIFCAQSWWSSTIAWQKEIIELIQYYLGTNQSFYPPAWVHNSSHEKLLHAADFKNIQSFTVTTPHLWSLSNLYGYLYSTIYCKPSRFGEKLQEFEREVESIFRKHNPSGECIEEFPFHVLIGYKRQSLN